MLYAEIHGKLVPEASDNERLEDVLTSTVWGTLFLASAWEIIEEWFARARDAADQGLSGARVNGGVTWFRFWPRLHEAEPDLMLRLGTTLIVVEAKYLSGKSGAGQDEAGNVRDQLARQWRSIDPQRSVLGGYPADVRDAIESATRRCIVYLVRGRDASKARREMAASLEHVPDAELYLLRWEDLHAVLTERMRASEAASRTWERDLAALLQRRGLRAFTGFRALWQQGSTARHQDLIPFVHRLQPRAWVPRFQECLDMSLVDLPAHVFRRLRRD